MRLLLFLIPAFALAQTPVITPATPPAVRQGGTQQFNSDITVTWSCPGCAGSIDASTGLYTAPASIKAKQQFGGCQVLPNNHIFNTKIDGLSVNGNNATYMATASTGSINYLKSFPSSFIDNSTPTQNMVFFYTPTNNGLFSIPPPSIIRMEGGWYVPPFEGQDRHILAVNKTTCNFQETYNIYPIGANTFNPCLTCNSQSGAKYGGSQYNLPSTSTAEATDAAGMFLEPLTLHIQEIEQAITNASTIKHAIRATMPNTWITANNIWPATANAFFVSGTIPYGTRFRLKSSFDIAGFCTSETWCAAAKVLLTQLKEYGIILADGGIAWQIQVGLEYIPTHISMAFTQITASITPSVIESVDQSGLMIGRESGDVNTDAETVVATPTPGTPASKRVVLQGVTIGVENSQYNFQAGASATQLVGWVNNATDTSITWTMSPTLGTLTSGGSYTPPATSSTVQTTLVKATSAEDSTVFIFARLIVLPDGIIRIASGSLVDYVDANSHTWLAGFATDASGDIIPVLSDADGQYGTIFDGGYPALPDINLYKTVATSRTDIRFEMRMPNGKYKITAKLIDPDGTSMPVIHLESQGQLVYQKINALAASGGVKTPIDYILPAEVTNGSFSFVVRKAQGNNAFGETITRIAAISIEVDPDQNPRITVDPATATVNVTEQRQMTCVGWYMAGTCTWARSGTIGTINGSGLYSFNVPISPSNSTTITATSTVDGTKTATSNLTLTAGVPTKRINTGGVGFTDVDTGNIWEPDNGFVAYPSNSNPTGLNYDFGGPVAGAGGLELMYQQERYNRCSDSLRYQFSSPNGIYNVTLHWSEPWSVDLGYPRNMNVVINGTTVHTNLDPVAAAGGIRKIYKQTYPIVIVGNMLTIDLVGPTNPPNCNSPNDLTTSINGIEIVYTGAISVTSNIKGKANLKGRINIK